MPPDVVETAAALIIGNELLSGKIQDANVLELARTLRGVGVRLLRASVLPDDIAVLTPEIRELSARFDVVFTSGGVGPTHDDVTIEAVARAFGKNVVHDPILTALIRKAYGERCTETHLRMALVPEGASLRSVPDVEWPITVMQNVWILPGVPEIFRSKLEGVRAGLRGPLPFFSRAVLTRLDEPGLKPLLDMVVARHPDVEIGSYPKWFEPTYRTKVTFDARQADLADAALDDLLGLLPELDVVRVE
jgi:molybdenum cofactor synthesis domain-containing protein